MSSSHTRAATTQRYLLPLLALVILAAMGYGINSIARERRQALVAARGGQVMPFDLDTTTHQFQPMATGGIQQVTAHDPADDEQVRLIRTHLQEEATRFRRGDFTDPATIHGDAMPGRADLRASGGRIEVEYRELPAGAQISYTTDDPALVAAIHRWFEAQLSDHGEHAAPGMRHE